MFKRVIANLLSGIDSSAPEPNYFAFEDSRALTKEEEGADMLLTQQKEAQNQNTQVKANAVLQADIQSDHQQKFYSFLFGEVTKQTLTDPLTEQVYEGLDGLFVEPSPILNALPVLPHSVTTLMREMNNPDFNVDTLIDIINHEPSMAANVIKLANSAGLRRGDKAVTDLKSAFMVMGSQGLMNGVVSSYLKNFVPAATVYYRKFGENIWQHCLTTAEYAQHLSTQYQAKLDANSAYFIGLICNLGEMVIFQVLLEAFEHVDPEHAPNTLAFQLMLIKHAKKLSYDIAVYWQLPEVIVRALYMQLNYSKRSAKEFLEGIEKAHLRPENQLGFVVYQANLLAELSALLSCGKLNSEQYQQSVKLLIGSEQAQAFGLSMVAS